MLDSMHSCLTFGGQEEKRLGCCLDPIFKHQLVLDLHCHVPWDFYAVGN